LLDAQKLLKGFYDSHSENLMSEIVRLQRLGTAFVESEQRRVAAEEQKRKDEYEAKLKAELDAIAAVRKAATPAQEMIANRKLEVAKAATTEIINAPEPVMEKAKGQTMKQVLKWEVTDLMELVKHNPQLCKIEPKASAINSTCHPNLKIPGLRCWFENVSTYTTR
jgi:polyribonucleotide nucleotidyltransferase